MDADYSVIGILPRFFQETAHVMKNPYGPRRGGFEWEHSRTRFAAFFGDPEDFAGYSLALSQGGCARKRSASNDGGVSSVRRREA